MTNFLQDAVKHFSLSYVPSDFLSPFQPESVSSIVTIGEVRGKRVRGVGREDKIISYYLNGVSSEKVS